MKVRPIQTASIRDGHATKAQPDPPFSTILAVLNDMKTRPRGESAAFGSNGPVAGTARAVVRLFRPGVIMGLTLSS